MGLHQRSDKIFLKISLGKIRKKVDAGTLKAVPRELEDGTTIHELLWNGIDGVLSGLLMREHKEYGKSWSILLDDDKDHYSIQMQENSRYGMDLLRKLPNLHKGHVYSFTPYDFEVDGARKSGLSIKTDTGDKVQSFYQTFETGKEGETIVKNINGFPDFTGDRKDKDDWKIYFAQVTKILRLKAIDYLKQDFEIDVVAESVTPAPSEERAILDAEGSDLPF